MAEQVIIGTSHFHPRVIRVLRSEPPCSTRRDDVIWKCVGALTAGTISAAGWFVVVAATMRVLR